jgi:hypothetical protein
MAGDAHDSAQSAPHDSSPPAATAKEATSTGNEAVSLPPDRWIQFYKRKAEVDAEGRHKLDSECDDTFMRKFREEFSAQFRRQDPSEEFYLRYLNELEPFDRKVGEENTLMSKGKYRVTDPAEDAVDVVNVHVPDYLVVRRDGDVESIMNVSSVETWVKSSPSAEQRCVACPEDTKSYTFDSLLRHIRLHHHLPLIMYYDYLKKKVMLGESI